MVACVRSLPSTSLRSIGRIQPVVATVASCAERSWSAKASAGVRQPRISRGRLLMVSALAWISDVLQRDRSVPFRKYCRSNQLRCSLLPRAFRLGEVDRQPDLVCQECMR